MYYTWKDQGGKIHYSDKIPPEHAAFKKDRINDKGVVVSTIQRPKTRSELKQERKLAKLRKQQQVLIQQQQSRDRLLLFTYDDVSSSVGDKLATIETKLKIVRNSIKNLESQLITQKQSAAQWEKSARSLPNTLKHKINELHTRIKSYRNVEQQHVANREHLKQAYAKDSERYKKLVISRAGEINALKEDLTNGSSNLENLSIVSCTSKQVCNKAWGITREYVLSNPDQKEIITESDLVISTSLPRAQADIGVSAVLIRKGRDQATIFLDIHCKQTVVGREKCESISSRTFLSQFRNYVTSRL
jgi:hypothetical protein